MMRCLKKIAEIVDGNPDVRVVDMKDYNPLFAFNVIKPGVCLCKRSEAERIRGEQEIMTRCFDTRHIRRIYGDYLEQSFKEGTYGQPIAFNT